MKHIHSGKFSKRILEVNKIIKELNIKEGQVFVDAGCGEGYFSMQVASKIGSHGKVYGIDIHEDSINSLNSSIRDDSILNIVPILSDIKKIPVKKDSVDIYYVSNVLHGFSNEESLEVINEANRVLKVGGKLAIVEFNKEETLIGPPIDIRLSKEELKEFFEPSGFKLKKNVDVGEYNYLVIFKKL